MNHKRVERLYREEKLSLRTKKRKKKGKHLQLVLSVPDRPNVCWSIDFVYDALMIGRALRCFTVIDDATRECPVIHVDFSITGKRVTEILDRVAAERCYPRYIRHDGGPEFSSKEFQLWAAAHKITLILIEPGKPFQNAFIESFNGRFRDECLNEHAFFSLADARRKIECWRREYMTERPHGSLGGYPPRVYAQRLKSEITTTGETLIRTGTK